MDDLRVDIGKEDAMLDQKETKVILFRFHNPFQEISIQTVTDTTVTFTTLGEPSPITVPKFDFGTKEGFWNRLPKAC